MENDPRHNDFRHWRRSMGICTPAPERTAPRRPRGCPKEVWPAFNKKRQHGQRNIQRKAG